MRGSFRFGNELCVGASLQVEQNAEHAPRSSRKRALLQVVQNAKHAPRSSLRSSLPPKQHFVCWGAPSR
jgi:hypothetical protein